MTTFLRHHSKDSIISKYSAIPKIPSFQRRLESRELIHSSFL
jgi:hypothetical protein